MAAIGSNVEYFDFAAEPREGDGATLTDTADGGMIVDFGDYKRKNVDFSLLPHDANLAEYIDERVLHKITADVLEGIDADLASRQDWEASFTEGLKLLGFKPEVRAFPFKGACGNFHPLLAEAVVRFNASSRGEMLPAAGPVRTQIVGASSPELQRAAQGVQAKMNFYLTEEDEEYYPDTDQMLFYLPIYGSTFKKVYSDPLTGAPRSRFITPDNLIVSYNTRSLSSAGRITQVMPTLKSEMRRLQLVGFYRDIDLVEPDEDQSVTQLVLDTIDGRAALMAQGDDRHIVFETHVDYDIEVKGLEHLNDKGEATGLALPYIVTIDKQSRKVLAVRRNWEEADPLMQRADYYVHFRLIPGLGFYGYGYVHLIGGATDVATGIMRQLFDAGTLHNFPAGFRKRGARLAEDAITLGPCEFPEIDTGDLPIGDAIMPLPYREPSVVQFQMLQALVEDARRLATTADMAVGDGNDEMPVGTTLALIEKATKIESAIVKRLHQAQRRELRLIAKLFGLEPTKVYPFRTPEGAQGEVQGASFNNGVDILPVADPNIPTQTQRLAMAQTKITLASQAPDIHNKREAYHDAYITMGLTEKDIARIMPPPNEVQPMDPVSENMAVMTEKPVKAGPLQDHKAHIAAHMVPMQSPTVPPAAKAALMAHIAEHTALDYWVQVQQVTGMQLPPPGQPMPPEMETGIALKVAQASDALQKYMQAGPGGAGVSPEIQLKTAELAFKEHDAQRKAATASEQNQAEVLKTQMQLRNDAAERDSKLQLNEMNMTKERMKHVAQMAQVAATIHEAKAGIGKERSKA